MTKQSQTKIADAYMLHFQNERLEYYALVPGCIYHLTYLVKVGDKTVRKRLSPRARDLYSYFLQIGWRSKKAWDKTEALADKIGCSVGTITNLKKELVHNFEQLNGKPLITIKKKKKRYVDNEGKNQSTDYDFITILDVNAESNAFMAAYIEAKKENVEWNGTMPVDDDDVFDEPVDKQGADSNNERGGGADSNIENASLGADSNIEHLYRTTEERTFCNTDRTTADAEMDCEYMEKISVIELATLAKTLKEKAFLELRLFGCDRNLTFEMLKRFHPQQIIDGLVYSREQQRRGVIKKSVQGYARRAIEQGRKWSDLKD